MHHRWYVDDHQRDHHSRWTGQLCQASNLFRFVRGSRRICLLGRSGMVRHLRKSRRCGRPRLIFSIHPSPGSVENSAVAQPVQFGCGISVTGNQPVKMTPTGALMHQAQARPMSTAFVFHEEVWTYERLAAAAERLACGLVARGLGDSITLSTRIRFSVHTGLRSLGA
jgi:hypothetical protein